MLLVLDDGAAEGRAELLVVIRDLAARVALRRGFGPEVVAGEGPESLAMELVGAGLGIGSHRRAGDLIKLGLVVRGNDLVLADGELRERIALRGEITRDTALLHIDLLAFVVFVLFVVVFFLCSLVLRC